MKNLKIIAHDCTGGAFCDYFVSRLPCEVFVKKVAGTESMSLMEALRDLGASVIAQGADFGFLWGDCYETISFVDDKGRYVENSYSANLFCEVLNQEKGCRHVVREENLSISEYQNKKDHSTSYLQCFDSEFCVVDKMFASEVSCGLINYRFCFRAMNNAFSGVFPVVLMIKILSINKYKLSLLHEELISNYSVGREYVIGYDMKEANDVLYEKFSSSGRIERFLGGFVCRTEDYSFRLFQNYCDGCTRLYVESLCDTVSSQRVVIEILTVLEAARNEIDSRHRGSGFDKDTSDKKYFCQNSTVSEFGRGREGCVGSKAVFDLKQENSFWLMEGTPPARSALGSSQNELCVKREDVPCRLNLYV